MTRRFDRLVQFDERSRAYPVRTLVAGRAPRSYTWRCGAQLDQGTEGACVGFSWAHEFAARPAEWPVSGTLARHVYKRAQQLDSWPGDAYEGTSVLAGAKASVELGYVSGYRWAFGLDDLILAIGYAGPAILGVNWHVNMMDPDSRGFIHLGGGIAGGHAILCRGLSLSGKYFILRNSWGQDWGLGGDCRVSIDDMRRLLEDEGEACIPQGRRPV